MIGGMKRCRNRKCKHCGQLYLPDPRTRHHQQYYSRPECRRASHAASQHRWQTKPANQDYFRGSTNVERVRAWRKRNPGYWRRHPLTEDALQDVCFVQPADMQVDTPSLTLSALQEMMISQLPVVVGLISSLTGSALQDEIAQTVRQLHTRGQLILDMGSGIKNQGVGKYDGKTSVVSGTLAAGP